MLLGFGGEDVDDEVEGGGDGGGRAEGLWRTISGRCMPERLARLTQDQQTHEAQTTQLSLLPMLFQWRKIPPK